MNRYEDLQDKIIVVTGAAGGMGLAIAEALQANGAVVIASDLAEGALPQHMSLDRLIYRQCDVANEAEIRDLLNFTTALYGRLDGAVNAAAVEYELNRLNECDIEQFDHIVAVNFRGVFLSMKYELEAMLSNRNGGAIVNIVSTTAFKPEPLQPIYGATKHAVLGLTRQAAKDYAIDGIRVNGVAPGNIDTPMLSSAIERRGIDFDRAKRFMPLGRFGTSQEIAEAVLWLCSDASSFTTGHVLSVEGGLLL